MSVDQHADVEPSHTSDAEVGVRVARPSLQSLLLEAGVASEDELRQAFDEGQQRGLRLGEVVLARGWLTQDGLAQMLARQWSLPFVPRESLGLDPAAAELLSVEQARELRACVIGAQDGGPLVVLAEPTTERLNVLRGLLGDSAHIAVVTESSLERLLEQRARVGSAHGKAVAGDAQPAADEAHVLDDPQTEALVAELEQATAGLSAARERIERLAGARRGAEQMVAELHGRLAELDQVRTREQERSRDLQAELEAERDRGRAFRRRLADLLAEFEG